MTAEQIEAIVEKQVEKRLAAKEQEEEAEKVEAKEKVNKATAASEYEQFTELHFIELREGATLKEGVKEKLETLKKKVKSRKGHMPKRSRTVHMGTGNGMIRIAKGYPVPEEIYQRFVDKGNAGVYFE